VPEESKVPEGRKEITPTKITTTKAPGFLASFFGLRAATDKSEDNAARVQKIARLAHQVRSVNPMFLLNEEEERALQALALFPEWLKVSHTLEESDQVLKALLNQPIKS